MEVNQTICFGDTLEVEGIKIYQPGEYSFVEEIRPGCFEETVLHLDVLPAILINDLAIIGDNGANSGAILVEIIGGNPPFGYLWNTGQTTESLFNVMHGTYSLTVTDQVGCTEIFLFDVPMISGVNEIESGMQQLVIRPNLIPAGQSVQFINSGKNRLDIYGMSWWSMNGKTISAWDKIGLDPGDITNVVVPEVLTPGLYHLTVYLATGETIGMKMIILE